MDFRKFLSCDPNDLPKYNIGSITNRLRQEFVVPEEPKPKPKLRGKEYVDDILRNHSIFVNYGAEDTTDDDGCTMSQVDDISTLSELHIGGDSDGEDVSDFYNRLFKDSMPEFNPHLEPIRRLRHHIVETIDTHQVTIVTGRTGCGKTTQIPQFILDGHRDKEMYCNIMVTQPRRIAAISIAKRVAQERKWGLGSVVGYKVSMDQVNSKETRLTYCTAGILLQILIAKKSSSIPYTHIFVDEVHERNDETDFLLIILKWILRTQQTNLKVILMSATMDTKKFSDYFSVFSPDERGEVPPYILIDDAPLFDVETLTLEGIKQFVKIPLPFIDFDKPSISPEMYEFAAELIRVFSASEKQRGLCEDGKLGGVLVFLPGFYEIETLYEVLYEKQEDTLFGEKWAIFPLHSTTAFEEQVKVFNPTEPGTRKIILATNIAESSLTVSDVTCIIDFCLVKLATQKEDTNYMSLELSWISKSQATQRAGRVGRVAPGQVFRLVPQYVYNAFEEDCPPEILRSPLDMLVLRAKQLNLGPPAVVLAHALDPPRLDNIHRTVLSLKEMGALQLTVKGIYQEDDGDFTSIGAIMAALPFETSLSKLIIMGHLFGCLEDCIIMACSMAVKSVFSNPFKKQLEAYNSRLSWSYNSSSDPLAYLNVYKLFKQHTYSGKFRRDGAQDQYTWAQRHFIQLRSLKEVEAIEKETIMRLSRLNIRLNRKKDENRWTNQEKPLVLKFILAGACYPHYFKYSPTIEEDAVRMVNGNSPYSSVYLKNFPLEQPRMLYKEVIRKKFLACGSGIDVTFDGSQKVYVHFKDSVTSTSSADQDDRKGKILLAVYRAVKMNQIKTPIEIPILPLTIAKAKAQELFGKDAESLLLCSTPPADEVDLGLCVTFLQAQVSEIVNPQCFWIQLMDEPASEKLLQITEHMSNPDMLMKTKKPFKIGDLCAAPYIYEESAVLFRSKVVNIDRSYSPRLLQVLYLDYGNTAFINENDVMAFTKAAHEIGLVNERPLAYKCSLAKVQPAVTSSLVGTWTDKSKEAFSHFLPNKQCIVKIYSVVEGTMNVHLFKVKNIFQIHTKEDTAEDRSLNNYLIKVGLALPAEEPYLSRENNAHREEAAKRMDHGSYPHSNKTPFFEAKQKLDPKHIFTDARSSVELKGPYSPLEVKLNGATKKNTSMKIQIDRLSVNSVLLDSYPMDSHDRFLVANGVSQGFLSNCLTLRNTTVMPNIHGLYYLITMIFSPFVELKHNDEKTQYVGALCGLGYDEATKESFYPEHDIKLDFDTVIDNSDLVQINKIKFYINYALRDDKKGYSAMINEAKVVLARRFLIKTLSELLMKSRESQPLGFVEDSEKWGRGFDPKALFASEYEEAGQCNIFNLIQGVNLVRKETEISPLSLSVNLQQISLAVNLKESLKEIITCQFCHKSFDKLKNLKMHVYTDRHKANVEQFKEMIESDGVSVAELSSCDGYSVDDLSFGRSDDVTGDNQTSQRLHERFADNASTLDDVSTIDDLSFYD